MSDSSDSMIAQLESRVSALESSLVQLMQTVSDNADNGGSESYYGAFGNWPMPVVGGEGGSFTGNTTDSVEIEGDVLFESASDANVEIATEKRTNSSQEEENVITVGVYYT